MDPVKETERSNVFNSIEPHQKGLEIDQILQFLQSLRKDSRQVHGWSS